MSIGNAHRASYEIRLRLQGQTVFVHSNFGTSEMQTFEIRGLKEVAEHNKRQTVFQFPQQIEAYQGDVIQIKGSRDYWKIIDTEDLIEDDIYIYMEAWVEKINERGVNVRLNDQGKAIFTGSNYGILQMGGQQNTQNVSIIHNVNPDFAEATKALIELVNNSSLPELEKEERLAEIERIKQLAQKEKTPEVEELGKSKIKLLETGLKVGELAVKAAPLIETLSKVFGG